MVQAIVLATTLPNKEGSWVLGLAPPGLIKQVAALEMH